MILAELVTQSKELIEKHGLLSYSYPLFFEQFEKLELVYQENKIKTDELCKELEGIIEEQKKLGKGEWASSDTFAESLIFNYSITVCKEAAKDEYLRDYSRAGKKYKEAVALLDFLAENSIEEDLDWKLFENFRNDYKILSYSHILNK